jgi:hypothetical protein
MSGMNGIEVIPFNVFMSVVPNSSTLAAIDGGLFFLGGVSVAVLALVVAEKLGFKVNEVAVRWTVRVCIGLFILWAVMTSGLLRLVLFG